MIKEYGKVVIALLLLICIAILMIASLGIAVFWFGAPIILTDFSYWFLTIYIGYIITWPVWFFIGRKLFQLNSFVIKWVSNLWENEGDRK